MRYGFSSGGQESGSAFSAPLCKIQAMKYYTESLLSVWKDKKKVFFSKSTVQLSSGSCTNDVSNVSGWKENGQQCVVFTRRFATG